MCIAVVALLALGCGTAGQRAAPRTSPEKPRQAEGIPGEPIPSERPYEAGPVEGLETVHTITVEAGPKSVELMPGGKRIFVNDLYAHKCFIFDAAGYGLISSFGLPDEPVEADFSEDGKLAWVSLYNSSKVLVLDTEAGSIVGEVPTGSIPKEIAVSPDGAWVYVANWNSNTITVIDARRREWVTDIPVPGTPRGICFPGAGDHAYVCIMGGGTLAEIDVAGGHRIARMIPCGSNPRHVVASHDGNVLFVSNNGPGTVTLVDRAAGRIIDTIKVGSQARTIALAPDGRYLFVCNYGEDTVGCVDLFERAQLFKVPASRPIGMTVSADGSQLFVSNYAPPQVTVMRIVRR